MYQLDLKVVPVGPPTREPDGPASGIDRSSSGVSVELGGGVASYSGLSSSLPSSSSYWSKVLCLLLGLRGSPSEGVSGTSSSTGPCALVGFWKVSLVACPTEGTALLVFTIS